MGLDDIDYENCRILGMSYSQAYHQTGNSIAVTVISLLTEHLYKAQYDNTYIYFDENFQNPHVD